MKTKFIQTRIDEDIFLKLKKRAEAEERSLSSLIRIIVKDYLDQQAGRGNIALNFKCKNCGWKPYPGVVVPCNKDMSLHYCPECNNILEK